MREIIHKIVSKLLTPTATSTGTITSTTLDCRGFDAAAIVFHYGATAPAPTSYKLQESDDDSTYNDVAAADVIDDATTHAVSTSRRVAYVGKKRYIQGVVVQSASTILTITGTLALPRAAPTANPA